MKKYKKNSAVFRCYCNCGECKSSELVDVRPNYLK